MRHFFLKWLFFSLGGACLLTFLLTYGIQTYDARHNAVQLIQLKCADIRRQIDQTEHNLRTIRQGQDANALAKVRALAEILQHHPALLQTPDGLTALRDELQVDQISVCDGKGIIVASTVPEYLGYDMATAAQSAEFLPALDNPDFALVQPPRLNGKGEFYQYTAVARRDTSGIVQIGYTPDRLLEAQATASLRHLGSSFRIGSDGHAIICRKGIIVSCRDSLYLDRTLATYGLPHSILSRNAPFNLTRDGVRYIGVSAYHNGYSLIGLLPAREVFTNRNKMFVILISCILILFAVVFWLVSSLVQNVVIAGIYQVNATLGKITGGDLSAVVTVRTHPEFIMLSEGINSMVASLRQAIAAEAARLAAELEFARQIQRSALPSVFPPYPDRGDFDLHAAHYMARAVGGDFFDFCLMDEQHLAFWTADVSGKGIPAALFMMKAKAVLKGLAESGAPLSAIMRQANLHLCENNEQGMFVTVFFAILNLADGTLHYINAGHCFPLHQPQQGPAAYIRTRPGLVMAAMENTLYREQTFTLAPGDRLLLYTDGITEALNPAQELFGEERLLQSLGCGTCDGDTLLAHIHTAVTVFADGEEQADDVTMLVLDYHP